MLRKIGKLKRNKRGDITDIIVLVILIFFLAISFIAVLFVNDKIQGVITDTEMNDTAAASSIVDSFDRVNSTTVQRGFVLFVSLLIVGVFVSSFLVKIHPVFIFLYIFLLGFAIFSSVFLGNLYDEFTSITEIQAIAQNQPMINYFMSHIVLVTLGVGALSMIIVFGKIFGVPGGSSPQADI